MGEHKYQQIINAVNEYVKEHGYVIKTANEIKDKEITGLEFIITD